MRVQVLLLAALFGTGMAAPVLNDGGALPVAREPQPVVLGRGAQADWRREVQADWRREVQADWRREAQADWKREAQADWKREAQADWKREAQPNGSKDWRRQDTGAYNSAQKRDVAVEGTSLSLESSAANRPAPAWRRS